MGQKQVLEGEPLQFLDASNLVYMLAQCTVKRQMRTPENKRIIDNLEVMLRGVSTPSGVVVRPYWDVKTPPEVPYTDVESKIIKWYITSVHNYAEGLRFFHNFMR